MTILRAVVSAADTELPLSVMARSAGSRLIAMLGVIALLWLAVAWAASQP